MDLKLIDEAIAAYEETLDEGYLSRLRFYRTFWAVMDEQSARVRGEVVLPSLAELEDCLREGRSFLSECPVEVDATLLIETVERLCACVTAEQSYPPDFRETFGAVTRLMPRIIRESDLGLAGSAPREYLAYLMNVFTASGIPQQACPLLTAVVSLALRVQLEPTAAALVEALAASKADDLPDARTCPVCGNWPTLSVLDASSKMRVSTRSLACTQCGTEWQFGFSACPHCGIDSLDDIQYFNIPGDETHLLAACNNCSEYVRTVSLQDTGQRYSIDVEDVVLTRLDEAIASLPSSSGQPVEEA